LFTPQQNQAIGGECLFVSQTAVYIRFRIVDGENMKLILCLTDTVVSK